MSMYRKWAKRRNAIMSVALFSMLAFPNVAAADAGIAKADSAKSGTITTSGNVHNVLADSVKGDTAINHFSKFDLHQGNIANLFFGTSKDSATAARLLNFVDSGVNIEGIVNAIQNNKIGGDLRFISPKGIVVSETGVINAGQVGMVVPTQKYYKQLLKTENLLKSEDFLSAKSIQNGEVPLNLDGSISVAGKINTIDGITLAAAKIELEDGALLSTKNSINYADLVNVKDANGKVTVQAGLTGDLQLTKDEAGDIVLAAVADSKNTAESSGIKNKLSNWLDKTGANVFRGANWDISEPIGASISMEKDAKIDTTGNVIIAAKAISNNVKPEDADEAAVKDAVKNTKALLGLQASVDLSGTINGQTINVAATTKDDYQFDKDMAKEIKSTSLLSKLKFSGSYMIHKDTADVKIGKDAKLTAAGEDVAAEVNEDNETGEKPEATPALSILSSSEIKAQLSSEGQVEGEKNQLAAATFSYYKNNANLIVDGKLKADAGSVSAVSDAKTSITATSSNLAGEKDTSHMNFAGNVAIGSTESRNTLNAGAELNAKKNISVAATLDNSLTVKAENSIKETGLGGSALNFVNTSEKAQVTDSAKITATDGNVEVNAAETNTLRQVVANNGTEKADPEKEDKDKDKDKDQTKAKDAEDDLGLSDLFGDATNAAKDADKEKEDKDSEEGKTKTSALESAAKYVTVGSSVNIVLGDSKAGVGITKNASISAGKEGALSVTAVQSNPDIQIGSIATSAAGSDGKAKSALINAAVSVTNLKNDASVAIAGSDGKEAVSLEGGSITLKAEANSGHGRLDKLVEDIKNIQNVKDKLLSYFTAAKWKEPRQHVTDFFTAVGNLKNIAEDPTALQTLVSRGKALYEDLEKNATELEKAGIDISKALEAIANLTNPEKVANYYVDSATRSNMVKNREKNTSEGGSSASVSLAGAVNMVSLDDQVRMLVGRQAKLNTEGDLTINSGVNKSDIAMNGHLKPSGASATSVGTVVNVFNSRADSVLAVADKAQLTGNNVSLTDKNDINHYILNGGSGSAANNSNKTGKNNDTVADTTALQGTVSYVGGESLAVVSVDNGAEITAAGEETKADKQKAIDEEWNKLSAEEQKKQKKETAKESGVVEIKAQNEARVLNIAGGLAYGNGSKGIGASVAVTNFDVKTLSAVSNNNIDNPDDIGSLARTLSVRGDKNMKPADYFGSAAAKAGKINAHSLDMNANADGYIHSVSVAGGVIEQTDNGTSGGSLANFVSNTSGKFSSFKDGYQNYFKPDETQEDGSVFSRTMDRFNKSQEDKDKQETGVANMTGGQTMPSFTLAGAGSVSVNLSANQTKSALRDANVTLRTNGEDMAAFANKAADSMFLGAWSGGAALSFQNIKLKKNTSDSATTVGISGAVAVNSVTSDVLAQVKNSKIQENDHAQQGSFVNTAEKKGALFAGGVGLTVSQARKNSYNFTGAASTSVNKGTSNVDAQVTGVNAKTKNITNKAMDTDTQVTGGVNLSIAAGGNGATSAGGTVAFAHLQNKVNAIFDGGTYEALGNLSNEAIASLTQVGGAVGVSVAAPKDGKSYGFQGVAAYNRLENDTKALLKGSATINADAVQNLAQDQKSDTTSDYKKYNAALQQADVDVDGDSYTDQLPQKDNEDTKAINEDLAKKGSYGNKIITAAIGLASSKNGSGLAAMAISDVKNDFSAKIENGTITLNNAAQDALKVRAYSNTLDVNTAAGAAVSKSGFGAAGSLSLQFTDNDVTAGVENVKNLSAKGISIEAGTGASEINVAGQVSVSGGAAFGMAMAYNLLNNDTNAYLKDSAINPDLTKFDPGSAMLAVKADSKASVYAVGAGVGISKGLGLNGASAINRGHNSTAAVVENTKANAIKKADVTAADTSKKLVVVGNVQGSGKAAIGGAFVYNDIGSSANHQKTKAAVKNSTLNGVKDQNSELTATAKDDSKLTTVGAGVGLSTGAVAVQGVVALTRIQKDVEASIEGSNIGSDKSRFAVTTAADTKDNLRTVAAVLSASKNAAIGAGLVMNTDKALTSAQISGGKLYTTGLTIEAKGLSTIHNIAAGGGVAAQGAGVVGSVAINDIQTKNRAVLSGGTEVDASGDSVLIAARGDENIKNIVGVLAAAGQGAGVGAAVAKNSIASENYAAVEGEKTKITAKNAKDKKVKDKLNNADQAIVGKLASAAKDKDNKSGAADGEKILDAAANLADLRGESSYKGIAVSASGTHTIKSLLVNAGIAGQGAAINGTFNVNDIGGSTLAKVDKARLLTEGDNDLSVIAHDYANVYGMVGTVSAAGQGVGAGIGSDTATVNRKTKAQISGQKRADDDIQARNVNLEADAWQGLASHVAGIGFAGMGAGIMFGTGVYTLASQTETAMDNVRANLRGSLYQQADHHGKLYSDAYSLGVAGVGAGVGAGVAVVKEQSKVDTLVNNSKVSFTNKGNSNIRALNDTRLTYELYNIGVGGIGGLAGSIGVANVTDDVTARVLNSEIGWNGVAIDGLSIAAENNIHFNNTAFTGAAGLAAGMGVGVVLNTIDSRVQTDIAGSKLSAKDISLTAKENRDIAQSAYNASLGAVGASANVMLTNVGQKLADSYESTTNKGKAADGSKVDVKGLLNSANNNTKKTQLKAEASQGRAGTTTAAVADTGGRERAGVGLNVSNSAMQATAGNIKLTSQATNNVTQGNKAVSFGGAVINGAVGILNNAGRTTLNLTNTYGKAAKNIEINTLLDGQNKLNILQGSAALTGAGSVAYAGLANNSVSSVNISGERLTADSGNIAINSKDAVKSNVNAIGVSIAGKAVGVLVAETSGTGSNSVAVGSDLEVNEKNAEINIQAQSAPETKLTAIAAVGSASFAGVGLSAQSEYTGRTTVDIAPKTSLKGAGLNIKAQNAPQITTQVGTGSLGMLAALSATGVRNAMGSQNNPHVTRVSIGENSSLLVPQVNIESNWQPYQNLDLISLSAGSAAVGVTQGILAAYGTNDVQVGRSAYAKDAELTVSANSTLGQDGVVRGLAAGGLASGSNFLSAVRNVRNTVNLGGMSNPQEKIREVITGSYNGLTQNFRAVGYGAGFASISPFTAVINDQEKRETNTILSGDWNLSGFMMANAQNADGNNMLTVDGKSAAMVGLSGVSMTRKADNTAKVQLKSGTRVTSDKEQSYNANNDLSVTEKVEAAGYGGINGSGSELKNTGIYRANVEIGEKNGKGAVSLTTNGEEAGISIGATTSGNVNAKNQLEAGGAASLIRASSQHDVNYDNNIILRNANLFNKGSISGINLGAADNTALNLVTVGNIQGGLGGKTTAITDNKLTRNAKVTLEGSSSLFSEGEISIAAGADAAGRTGNLDLSVMADVYNRTAIPVSTKPRITNSMKQANQVDIGKGSKVTAARDMVITANSGKESMLESAYIYTTYSNKVNNNLVAVLPNEKNSKEQQNNFVNIAGDVKAGIYNSLGLEISSSAANGSQQVKVTEGGNWFDAKSVKTGQEVTVNNPYLKEYNELKTARQGNMDADLRKSYDAAINHILQSMLTKGFARKNGNDYEVLSSLKVKATVLPNIRITGANVDVYSPNLKVSGSIKALGAERIKIADKSDGRLVVNNLELDSLGGQVRLNGSIYKAANIQSANGSSVPNITIEKTAGKGNGSDLHISGNIINNAGKVSLTNNVGDILNTGTISAAYATSVNAPNGSYSQMAVGGTQVVGLDPLAPYTFGSEMFAKELYRYLLNQGIDGIARSVYLSNPLDNGKLLSIGDYQSFLKETVWKVVFPQLQKTEAGRAEIARIMGISYAQYMKNSMEQNLAILKAKYAAPTKEGAIVSSGDVSISAKNIIVNGLIQSGYASYTTAVDQNKLKMLVFDKQARKGVSLTDSDVLGNAAYLVDLDSAKGGNIWNSSRNVYDGVIHTYYNPYTGHLLTADTVVKGGNIHLNGNIYSTIAGAGRILSAKGAADITINATNECNKELYVGAITNNYRNGNITINGQLQTGSSYKPKPKETLLWEMYSTAVDNQKFDYKVKKNFHNEQMTGDKTVKLDWFANLSNGQGGNEKIRKEVVRINNTATTDANELKNFSSKFMLTNGFSWYLNKLYFKERGRDGATLSPANPQGLYEDPGWFQTKFYRYTYNRKLNLYLHTLAAIQADRAIETRPLEAKNGGSIKITNNAHIVLTDNIIGAVKDGKGLGRIDIQSTNGGIIAKEGKFVSTDNFGFSSSWDTLLTLTGPSKMQTLSGESSTGVDIRAQKGLLVEKVRANQTLNLTAQGDIQKAKSSGDILEAANINLTSLTGSIGSSGTGGYISTYAWKRNGNGVSAKAKGNIYIEGAKGDLWLGKIVSTDGDVFLRTKDSNASILDGIGTRGSLSDSQNKVNTWLSMGIISNEDEDSSSAEAAANEKAERLAGVTGRLQTLGLASGKDTTYYTNIAKAFAQDAGVKSRKAAFEAKAQKITDDAEFDKLFQNYQQEQLAWFNSAYAGLSEAERRAVMDYGLLEASQDYGFSKNQLLYAVQDSVVNSAPGQLMVISQPNITAKNVTLETNASIGWYESGSVIRAKDINKLENLQSLSQAKAGDIIWYSNGSIALKKHLPVSLDLRKGGTITVKKRPESRGGIFLAGSENTTFNFTGGFGEAVPNCDVMLMTGNGIYLPNDGKSVISGDKVTLYAGRGNIGSLDNYLRTNIYGYLDANASGSTFISNEGDLTIVSAVAGADRRPVMVGSNQVQPIAEGETAGLFLKTTGNMMMSRTQGMNTGYLMGSSVNLSAANLGTSGTPLRIYANGAMLNFDSDAAFLRAMGTGEPLRINNYKLNSLTLENSERFIWMLDRSDALYKDLYGFYGDDWLESPFATKEPYRLAESDEDEVVEIEDAVMENEGVTRETNQTNMAAERPQELAIVKDVEGGMKIVENQQ